MTPERWKEVEAVFEQALELPAAERPAFLESWDADEELRREVESLLDSHRQAGEFIDKRSLFFESDAREEIEEATGPGELIGPYRVLREIGRGGMGAVYLAERADEQYQKQVALKLIKRGMDSEAVLRHFRNERQILASFDHPNIARLFDGGTTADGLPYFVMEYVEGIAIDRYCQTHDLPLIDRLKLFREVCAAVSYAHRHAVIHRDIKPSNILVTADGRPKLLDFGIAKILDPGAGDALMTATGARPMTPEYASPEQVRGEPVTTASDVYSLGIVLYEILTGELPYHFPSKSAYDMARTITDDEPKRPSALSRERNRKSTIENRKSLKGDLDNILLLALRKEPARRYQSVEQFSDDIRRHLEARPVRARKDTVGYRASRFIRRNRAATAAAVLVLLSLIGGLISTTWEAQRAKAEKARAERRFKDVRQLAHSVLFDYHDAIKDLPGATRARERLVKDALVYLDSLASEAAGDPGLQRELAAAYERVGDVRGQAYSANLGDRAGAQDSYLKSLQIRESLAASNPNDVVNRRQLAATYRKMGNDMLETTEARRGLEYLQKALVFSSQLADNDKENPDLQRELAETYNDIGLALEDRGDMAGALEHQRKALGLREALVVKNRNDITARRDLSVTYVNTGRALFFTGDVAAAIDINLKGLEIRKTLLQQDAANADYRRLVAIAYQNDGDYRAQSGDTAGALESFRKKIVLDEESLLADPANAQGRGDYAYSSERLGVLSATLGRYGEALQHFQHNLTIREKIASEDQQNVAEQHKATLAHAEVAMATAHAGTANAALAEVSATSDRLTHLPDDPANVYLRGLRARTYGFLGDTYATVASSTSSKNDKIARWRNARRMYEAALGIWNDLRARGLLPADDATKPQELSDAIAKCDAALPPQ